jgi:hypothetical protein
MNRKQRRERAKLYIKAMKVIAKNARLRQASKDQTTPSKDIQGSEL